MMKDILILFAILLYASSLRPVSSELLPSSPHVCPKENAYNVTYLQSYMATDRRKYNTICLSFPPVCTRYKLYYYIAYRTAYKTETNTTYECCPGYLKVFGSCIQCSEGRYGRNCEGVCKCQNNGICNKVTGDCECPPGRKGKWCEFSCDDGTHGKECVHQCDCKNGAGCDPEDGFCICRSGFTGEKCEKTCEDGTWGHGCSHKCSCFNGATCLPSSGICVCAPGYMGDDCNTPCPPGTYGDQCLADCGCQNNAWCEHKEGRCLCGPGYHGIYCEKECQSWFYGAQCGLECSCVKNTTQYCDYISGDCICMPGWTGSSCETRCENGTWGDSCQNTCLCGDDISCHHVTGECPCRPGRTGYNCTEVCPDGYYGAMCTQKCNCAEGYICSPVSGCMQAQSSERKMINISGYSEKQMNLLQILVGVAVTCVLVFAFTIWVMRKHMKKIVRKPSTVALHMVEDRREGSEPSTGFSKEQFCKENHVALENIYEEVTHKTKQSDLPILEPLYENENLDDLKRRSNYTGPRLSFEVYCDGDSDAIYQEVDYATTLSRNLSENRNIKLNEGFQNAHCNNLYGVEEDENEITKKQGATGPGVYSHLNLEKDEDLLADVNCYDKLKR